MLVDPCIHPHGGDDLYQGGYVDFTPWTPEMAANPRQPYRHSIREDIAFYWQQEWLRTGRCAPMDDPMTAAIFELPIRVAIRAAIQAAVIFLTLVTRRGKF